MSYPVRWGAMSYPDMQYRTRTRNVVPGGAMSYTEVQCRNRTCNVVPGVAMLYQEVQCRTRTCNVVSGYPISYPDMQCCTWRCNIVPGRRFSPGRKEGLSLQCYSGLTQWCCWILNQITSEQVEAHPILGYSLYQNLFGPPKRFFERFFKKLKQ